MYTLEQLLANVPDFERTRILGGQSPYKQPIMPGEQRLIPAMQEKMQPALPPVKQAGVDPYDFLNARLAEYGNVSQVTPGALMQIVRPNALPYVKTPTDTELERRMMEKIVPGHSAEDLRLLFPSI